MGREGEGEGDMVFRRTKGESAIANKVKSGKVEN